MGTNTLSESKIKDLDLMIEHLIERSADDCYDDMGTLLEFSFKAFICSKAWDGIRLERREQLADAYNHLRYTLTVIQDAVFDIDLAVSHLLSVKLKKEAV